MFDPNKPTEVEENWPREWRKSDLHRAVESQDKPKKPFLDFLTSLCGERLQLGYSRNNVTTDCPSRYIRMEGFNVSHPLGGDASGEPTEEHAVTPGIHSMETTDHNADKFRRRLNIVGAFLILRFPAAPFIIEELWQLSCHEKSIHYQDCSFWDDRLVEDGNVQIPIQINEKLQDVIAVSDIDSREELEAVAFNCGKVQQRTASGKDMNIITKGSPSD